MKAWQIDRLGGKLSFNDIAIPEVSPGSVLVRVETQTLMSYPKDFVEGKLPAYRAPDNFFPGGNAIGIIEAAPITIGASRCASMKAANVQDRRRSKISRSFWDRAARVKGFCRKAISVCRMP